MKKFDLHIHTIPTPLDSEFSFNIDCLKQYVQSSALDAIAITNHNTFDLEQFRCIQKQIEDFTVVFPGIEISIGQNSGHMIIVANPDSLEDFASRCEKVADFISKEGDALSLDKFIEIFPDLQKYLLIPHYEKKRAVDKSILATLRENIYCGEVGSVKKFIYCQKDDGSLTPVYFSDWRASERVAFPTRHTWLDVEEITIPGIKNALQDKSKVQLSDDEGHRVFQVLPNLKISTGLSIIIGGRSSGKTYTLNQINNVTDRVKYIRQFSLLEQEPQKAEERFGRRIAEKQSAVMREYYQPFINVVDEIADISLIEDEKSVEKYLSSLLKHAEEIERIDAFSNCALFTESEYTIDKLDNLKDLISAVEKLLDARVYKDIIEKNIRREQLLSLHKDLIAKYVEEHQLMLKKIWVNDIIMNVKRSLQSKTAATRIEAVDLYSIQMNRKKVERFNKLVEQLKNKSTIKEQNIEGFKIQVIKRPYASSGELKTQSGRRIGFSDIFESYNNNPFEFLKGLSEKEGIEAKDYYLFFAKIEYKILNQYGYEVSGGERAEFNLLQEINDAYQYDMLLIDEPESSFDNLFLRDRVNHIIKEISSVLPVVIVTHNSTVGASIRPDYIIHTKREIEDGNPVFEVYYGAPGSKMLVSDSGKQIRNIDATLDCLEAGQSAYDERRRDYEMLRN